MEYSERKYKEKTRYFDEIRQSARALRRVVGEKGELKKWDPATLAGTADEVEKQSSFGRDVGGVVDYFEHCQVGALEHICSDSFDLTYHVYGDVGRKAMFGQNTNSFNMTIDWQRCNVEAELYTGVSSEIMVNEKIGAINRSGLADRSVVGHCTGWNPEAVKRLADADVAQLVQLLKAVSAGQNKITRLVKGFLLMLECMERDHIDVMRSIPNSVLYCPSDILATHQHQGRSYVWNSNPRSEAHTLVLATMGESYPPAFIQSHVRIPADGKDVFIVGGGSIPPPVVDVRLTANLVYTSILTYAIDVGVTDDLQSALVIACSLQQNRYFSKVGLPLVVAYNDLMIPIMTIGATAINKPMVSKPMSRSLGRIHQMLCFTTARDIITAGMLTTKSGFDGAQSIRAYLSYQEGLVERMGSYFTDIKLMELTPAMKFLSRLDETDFSDLASISILEGLWLCDRTKKVAHNGAIAALKEGVIDMSGDVGTKEILINELQLAGVLVELDKIPVGEFIVEGCCVNSQQTRAERRPRRVRKPMELVQVCDFKPGEMDIIRKPRFGPIKAKVIKVLPVRKMRPQSQSEFVMSGGLGSPSLRATPSPPRDTKVFPPTPRRESSPPPYIQKSPPSSPISSEKSGGYALPSRLASEATGSPPSATAADVQHIVQQNDVDIVITRNDLNPVDRPLLEAIDVQGEDDLDKLAVKLFSHLAARPEFPLTQGLRDRLISIALFNQGFDDSNSTFFQEVLKYEKKGTNTQRQFWALKSVTDYVTKRVALGMVGEAYTTPETVDGRLQPLVEALDVGAPGTLGKGPVSRMRLEGKDWEGDIDCS